MSDAGQITCISVGIHAARLTRGRIYAIEARRSDNYRIRDDHGRLRYFPATLFVSGHKVIPRIRSIDFDPGDIEASPCLIEATITLDSGERRLCWLGTPDHLDRIGDILPDTDVRIHVDNRLLHIASRLDESIARRLLHHVWSRGLLTETSAPVSVDLDAPE